jgi:hypothetical protein
MTFTSIARHQSMPTLHRATVSCPHPGRVILVTEQAYSPALRLVLVVVAVAHRSCPVSGLLGDESLMAAVSGGS